MLVHCQAGVSRSASVVVAHLMASLGLSYEMAFAMVKGARSVVMPNVGFVRQLKFWETDLGGDLDVLRTGGEIGGTEGDASAVDADGSEAAAAAVANPEAVERYAAWLEAQALAESQVRRTSVVIDAIPGGSDIDLAGGDDEGDGSGGMDAVLDNLEARLRSYSLPTLVWGEMRREPLVFGLFKLRWAAGGSG